MSKKMVTTQPGLFLFTDKDSAFQVTETGATVNGKELGMSEAWAWIMDAIDTKAKRVPDPTTGLMPCGCGGKAEIGQYCEVTCDKCGASVPANYTEADAKEAWNRAMGYTARNQTEQP